MPEIDLDYLNDRYLAFVLPLELRRLVGQGVLSWFLTGNEKEPVTSPEDDIDAFPTIFEVLESRLRSAIGRFTELTGCWQTNIDKGDKLQNWSEKLINANQQYVKTLQSTWLNERHQCYIKIANHYSKYPNICLITGK